MESTKPSKTFRAKTISLSMWEKEGDFENTLKQFSFQKSYKNESDEWQTTHVLNVSDLPVLKTLLDEAYKDVLIKE